MAFRSRLKKREEGPGGKTPGGVFRPGASPSLGDGESARAGGGVGGGAIAAPVPATAGGKDRKKKPSPLPLLFEIRYILAKISDYKMFAGRAEKRRIDDLVRRIDEFGVP